MGLNVFGVFGKCIGGRSEIVSDGSGIVLARLWVCV